MMKRLTLPKLARGRKWLMISIANLILQAILGAVMCALVGMIGLVIVIYFQALLMLIAGYYYPDPQPTQQGKEV